MVSPHKRGRGGGTRLTWKDGQPTLTGEVTPTQTLWTKPIPYNWPSLTLRQFPNFRKRVIFKENVKRKWFSCKDWSMIRGRLLNSVSLVSREVSTRRSELPVDWTSVYWLTSDLVPGVTWCLCTWFVHEWQWTVNLNTNDPWLSFSYVSHRITPSVTRVGTAFYPFNSKSLQHIERTEHLPSWPQVETETSEIRHREKLVSQSVSNLDYKLFGDLHDASATGTTTMVASVVLFWGSQDKMVPPFPSLLT